MGNDISNTVLLCKGDGQYLGAWVYPQFRIMRYEAESKTIPHFGVDGYAMLSVEVLLGGGETLIVAITVDSQSKLEPLPRWTDESKTDVRIGYHGLAQLMEAINVVNVDLNQAGMNGGRLAVGACAAHCERRQQALYLVISFVVSGPHRPQSFDTIRERAALDLVQYGAKGHVAAWAL
jgi:hypothetical protein